MDYFLNHCFIKTPLDELLETNEPKQILFNEGSNDMDKWTTCKFCVVLEKEPVNSKYSF